MNLGISILFKKPEVAPAQLFSFMNPLALEVRRKRKTWRNLLFLQIWIYILLAYILVSLTIWIVARYLTWHSLLVSYTCVSARFTVV